MSYCRKGHDSDLYILGTRDGYECLACPFLDGHESTSFPDSDSLWWHVQDHLAEGHKVPEDTLMRIEADVEALREDDEGVGQDVEFRALLHKLAAPKMVMDFYVMTGRIIEILDNAEEDGVDFSDLFPNEEFLNHPAWEWND